MEIVDLLDQIIENDEVVDGMFVEAARNAAADVNMDEMMAQAEDEVFVDSLFV